MRIVVIGAGVLGSVYAARLQQAGNQVTILARGKRLKEIRENGLLLEDENTGKRITACVHPLETLSPALSFDLAIVLVRKNQLDSVLPILQDRPDIPAVLWMINNAAGPGQIVGAIGRERVLLGFPGAGGQREGEIIRYRIVPGLLQPTTIGELGGQISPRLRSIASELRKAGFPVDLCSNMDAWLKTHVAVVSPIANAIYSAGGDIFRLARSRNSLGLMVRAIREGFKVLEVLGIPITPAKFRLVRWLPSPVLVSALQDIFATSQAELVLARHANAARDEMKTLADEFRDLARQAQVSTPAIDSLYQYLDP